MEDNPYESKALLDQYLLFHYGSAKDQFPYSFGGQDALDFPLRCVEEGLDLKAIPEGARALDLGCAVGRSSFELARYCESVIGIDYSKAFIDAANAVRMQGACLIERLDEGSKVSTLEVSLDGAIDRDRLSFEVGDAQTLRADLEGFDILIACNLICRLPDPNKLLARLPHLVKPGGQLFITTPFTWLEEYTPRCNWLGEGAQSSFEGLRKALEPAFTLESVKDMPFLIREHSRKFQYSIAQGSRWRRNASE